MAEEAEEADEAEVAEEEDVLNMMPAFPVNDTFVKRTIYERLVYLWSLLSFSLPTILT